MSNLDRLRETLAGEAAGQAAEIRAEAERRAAEIRAEAGVQAERLRAEAVRAAQREIELRQRQSAAEERLLRRQALLEAKAELVGRAMTIALEKLADLPEEQYRALLSRLIEENAPDGQVTVVLNRRDQARLGEGFVKQVAGNLAARGRRVELVLSPAAEELAGGVKLVGRDFEVDCSLERLLELAAEAVEPEVAKVLFG
ncbi:MAG: V-type ATP synthase subunit E family protein [Bacillota bacterium]|nr:V-type ATP synthase subunit E family protein [Bacillota bacterium]